MKQKQKTPDKSVQDQDQERLQRQASMVWQGHGRVPEGASTAEKKPGERAPPPTQPAERDTADPLEDPAKFAGF